ncbi:MAG: hypothetical protein KC503_38195 [Myxococcales bacterium]|nr:hypothetical protein [Myxococcales bacterium]
MRKLAGVFLIVAVPIAAVLGVLLLFSSQHQKVMAEIEANDLTSVASDLMDPKELAKQRAAAAKRKKKTHAAKRGTQQRVLAYGLFAAALTLLVSGIMSLLGRKRALVVALSAIGVIAFALTLLLESTSALCIAGAALAVLGAALAATSKAGTWRSRAAATAAAATAEPAA